MQGEMVMGWPAWVLAAMVLARVQLASHPEEPTHYYLVDFAPDADAELLSRELCLQYGCEVHHVYRSLPGMAVSGGRAASLAHADQVTAMYRDQLVSFDPGGNQLIGAPQWAPLVVVGPALDPNRLSVERRSAFGANGFDAAPDGTALVYSLASRVPDRRFWTFPTLAEDGRGRLSDMLAALDAVVAYRFAVSAVYVPLALEGTPPPRLCATIDDLLQRGVLVLSGLDGRCPLVPAGAFRPAGHRGD